MANTQIALKKSPTPGSSPSAASLANGEIAINYADGILYYKNVTGQIAQISSGDYFGTVNANGSLLTSTTPGDVVSILNGQNITISTDVIYNRLTISADLTSANGWANLIGSSANSYSNANARSLAANVAVLTGFVTSNANAISLSTNVNILAATLTNSNSSLTSLTSNVSTLVSSYANANTTLNSLVGSVASNWFVTNAAYQKANSALPNTSGVSFDGNLTVAGNTIVLGSLITTAGIASSENGVLRITNPGGASNSQPVVSITGAIKIRLPAAANNSSTMMRMKVQVYNYAGTTNGTSLSLELGGYNYNGGNWYNMFATQQTMGGDNINVRFGYDTVSDCIWIGETSSTWAYPRVAVTDFMAGNATLATYDNGWDVSFVTSFDTVEQTLVAAKPLNAVNYTSYTPTLSMYGSSFTVLNAAYTSANAGVVALGSANSLWAVTNASYTSANAGVLALGSANSLWAVTNASYLQANTGNTTASLAYNASNSSFSILNVAYLTANNALPKVGGTISGDLSIVGNITVTGTQTYANTQTLLVGDNILTLNADLPGNATPTENGGIEINRGSAAANAGVIWVESIDAWAITSNTTAPINTYIASNADITGAHQSINSNWAVTNAVYTSANAGVLALGSANSNWIVTNAAYTSANAGVIALGSANSNWVVTNAAYNLANSKTFTFNQNTAPATANADDMWVHSDTGVVYENFGNTTNPVWAEFGPTGVADTLPGTVLTSNLVFSDGRFQNTSANYIGASGNSYAVSVAASANNWANTKLSNTSGVTFAGSLTVTGNTTVNGIAPNYAPNRPAFRVYGSGTTNNLTTTQNGTGCLTSNNWTVSYNQGTYLANNTGVFTAPVAGLYQVNVIGRNSGYASGISQIGVTKNGSSGGTVGGECILMVEFAASSTMNHAGGSTIINLAVGDTLACKILAGQINFDGNDNWSVAYIG